MARRVYHGIAGAQPVDGVYRVDIHDIDITAGEFSFNEGDLLVVFFAAKNEVAQPKLAIYINDTENEVSISNDEGHFVKQYDVEADCTDAWDNGETVAFAYTQRGTNETYYWEMINGVHASTEVYGDTKLFDLPVSSEDPEDLVFPDWINGELGAETEDTTTSLAPNMLKKLYQLLVKNDNQNQGLIWTPETPSEQILGTLTLTSSGDSVNITYPLDSVIAAKIEELGDIPTHTSKLINDGTGIIAANSEPLITKRPADSIYFTTGNGLGYTYVSDQQLVEDISRIILNDESNKIVIGDEQDEDLAGITLGKPTEVKGNLLVSGNIIAGEPLSVEQTSPEIMAPNFRENGVLLEEKYSPKLEVFKFSQICENIPTNSCGTPIHRTIDVSKSGYTPIGVVGYNVNMTGSSADGLEGYFANVWECYLKNSTTVEFSIYNLRNKAITVQMEIYVLYHKDIEGGEQ